MKYCNICKTEKEDIEFHKRKASKDGLAARCKSCQAVYDKARLHDPKRMKARRDYQKTQRGKEVHSKACKKWVKNNEIKRSAHILVGNALKSGKITKPDNCENCGSADKLNGHHDDYAYPLTVRWLCDNCHNEWHRENGEGKNAR